MLSMLLALTIAMQTNPSPASSPAAAPASAASASAASPITAIAEDPALTKRAKEWFRRMETGNVDRDQLDAEVKSGLTNELVKKTAAALGPLGTPKSFTYVQTLTDGDITTAVYRLAFPNGSVLWNFSVDKSGHIAGFYLRPDAQS
jgi:acetyl esterase/lipase